MHVRTHTPSTDRQPRASGVGRLAANQFGSPLPPGKHRECGLPTRAAERTPAGPLASLCPAAPIGLRSSPACTARHQLGAQPVAALSLTRPRQPWGRKPDTAPTHQPTTHIMPPAFPTLCASGARLSIVQRGDVPPLCLFFLEERQTRLYCLLLRHLTSF